MDKEYKPKTDVPDLYSILGLKTDVCREPNCQELIQKAYIRKAKVCHPDKHPGRKDAEEIFELLTSAYDILRDEKQRAMYNRKLELDKQSSSDFFKLKDSAESYAKSFGEYKPPTDTQISTFKDQMALLDEKHQYDSSIEKVAIPQVDAKKKMNEMAKTRAEQDRELMPEKLFDDGRFDLGKFNSAFDLVHKREDTAITAISGVPNAWNGFGAIANYSQFDNLDNLYVSSDDKRQDTSRQTYSGIDFGTQSKKITKEEMANISRADYVEGHKILGDDYYRTMKHSLRDREADTTKFEAMKYNDFKRSDTAGYGVLDQIGFDFSDRLTLDVDDDDLAKKYERLIAERNKPVVVGETVDSNKKSKRAGR